MAKQKKGKPINTKNNTEVPEEIEPTNNIEEIEPDIMLPDIQMLDDNEVILGFENLLDSAGANLQKVNDAVNWFVE